MHKLPLKLDLQFFAEDPNPDPNQQQQGQQQNDPNAEKKFTQEDLNRINIKGKEDGKKAVYKALGVNTDDEFNALLETNKANGEKAGKVADLEKKVAELEAEKLKNTYLTEIRRSNVSDEYVEVVYSTVLPIKDEKPEAYSVRINDYLKTRPALLKAAQGTQYFNTNANYGGKPANKEPVNLQDALQERFGKK